MLIYFDAETSRDILRRARRLLNANAYLFLGGSETDRPSGSRSNLSSAPAVLIARRKTVGLRLFEPRGKPLAERAAPRSAGRPKPMLRRYT